METSPVLNKCWVVAVLDHSAESVLRSALEVLVREAAALVVFTASNFPFKQLVAQRYNCKQTVSSLCTLVDEQTR